MTDSPWAALAAGEHVDQPLLPEQHRDRRGQQAGLQEVAQEEGRRRGERLPRHLGLYPIVTFQYRSTTLYQISYHIQYLFF